MNALSLHDLAERNWQCRRAVCPSDLRRNSSSTLQTSEWRIALLKLLTICSLRLEEAVTANQSGLVPQSKWQCGSDVAELLYLVEARGERRPRWPGARPHWPTGLDGSRPRPTPLRAGALACPDRPGARIHRPDDDQSPSSGLDHVERCAALRGWPTCSVCSSSSSSTCVSATTATATFTAITIACSSAIIDTRRLHAPA